MTFEVPEGLFYRETHEWLAVDGDRGTIGITDFAQDELGDVVFVELPGVGDELTADESFGAVESIKAVSDLYAPVSGTVVAVNDAVDSAPELLNDDPYGEGWLLEIELASDDTSDLLSADAYREQTE